MADEDGKKADDDAAAKMDGLSPASPTALDSPHADGGCLGAPVKITIPVLDIDAMTASERLGLLKCMIDLTLQGTIED